MTDKPTVAVSLATDAALADEIAEVAAITFPLACPPHSPPEAIRGFIEHNLSPTQFRNYIADDAAAVLIATDGSGVIGYCLVLHRDPPDPDVAAVVVGQPVSEVSKMYVLPDHHGAGASHALMDAAIDVATDHHSEVLWLGVNNENVRAQRFYAKKGFARVGTKTFNLAGVIEHDYVLSRQLTEPAVNTRAN